MSTGQYDRDYAEWAAETAKLLREGRLQEVDLDHVAEEIEDMGNCGAGSPRFWSTCSSSS